MTNRCAWCNRADGDLREIEVASPGRSGASPKAQRVIIHVEHEAQFRNYNDRVSKFGRRFLVLVGICLVAMIVMEFVLVKVSLSLGIAAIGAAVAFVGGAIILFPFATPETIRAFGVRAGIRMARSAGALLVAAGGVVAALAFT